MAVDPLTPGTYVVTYDAVDFSGNAALQVTRTVIVQDNQPPVITLNGPALLLLECHGDPYVEPGAVAIDACEGELDVTIGGAGAIDVTAVGAQFIVTYDAVDAQLQAAAQVTRTVEIVDTTPPEFTVTPVDLTVTCDPAGNDDAINAWLNSAEAIDSCGNVTITNTYTGFVGCETAVPVLFSADDESGNRTTVLATIFREPDTTLTGLQAVNASTRVIVGPNDTTLALIEFENTGPCPIEVTGVGFVADFTNPALSTALTLPIVVCPGDVVSIPVEVTTTNVFSTAYNALVRLDGADGVSSAGLEICVATNFLPDLTPISAAGVRVQGSINASPPLDSGEAFTVFTDVSNIGAAAASAFDVSFLAVVGEEEVLLGTTQVSGGLAVGASTTVSQAVPGTVLPDGFHIIRVQVAPPLEGDLMETNNAAVTFVQVGSLLVGDAIGRLARSNSFRKPLIEGTSEPAASACKRLNYYSAG